MPSRGRRAVYDADTTTEDGCGWDGGSARLLPTSAKLPRLPLKSRLGRPARNPLAIHFVFMGFHIELTVIKISALLHLETVLLLIETSPIRSISRDYVCGWCRVASGRRV